MLGPHPRRVWRPNGAMILVTAKYINAATRYIPQSAILNTTSDPSSPSCCSCDNPCSILPSSIITPAQQASEREAANNLSSASGKRVAHRRQVSAGNSSSFSRTLYYQPFILLAKSRQKKKKKIELRYLPCSQIWLNLSVDHCHFGYITN
jgi:hypothetical protein